MISVSRAAVTLALAAIPAAPLPAQQGVFISVGRVLAGTPVESSLHITVQHDIMGPLGVDASFVKLPGSRESAFGNPPPMGDLYGVGADLTLFSAARGIPTLFIGVSGGTGFVEPTRLWAGWSAGVRMPLLVIGPVRVMGEGRFRQFSIQGRDGLELSAAFGYREVVHAASNSRPESAGLWAAPATADALKAGGIPEAKAKILGNVVSISALDEMGQPYLWGGTGDGNGGFDCSGLIQYVYARYGIALPRTALGQSAAGVAIARDIDRLLPGDILVFGDRADTPTHVGMYVGQGHFIHSASRGVKLSRLAEDDPDGRTWLHKWIGVRRVVE